jgi:hypothetical protein
MDLSAAFAWTIAVLAFLAVVAVLVFVIVWAVCATRRTLATHHPRTVVPPFDPTARYWRERSAVTIPERHP